MTIPQTAAKRFFRIISLFGLFGWAAALFCVNQIQVVDVDYRLAIEQQANAAFVLANANHLLVAERDDLAEMLIDNTAAGSAADLDQLKSDETAFAQAMTSAAGLSPVHAGAILALRARAEQLLDRACQNAIGLGAVATTNGPILASQAAYLAQCAPNFPPMVMDLTAMQNRLRNERNAQITQLKAANAAHIKLLFRAMLVGLLFMLAIVALASRAWLGAPAAGDLAIGAGGAR